MDENKLLSLFLQVCEGIKYLHSFSPPIYHRDIKIENIMMINDTVKLLDFGSATTKVINYKTTLIKDFIHEEIDIYMNTSKPYR
jgi:serine/threonine protein kinase